MLRCVRSTEIYLHMGVGILFLDNKLDPMLSSKRNQLIAQAAQRNNVVSIFTDHAFKTSR